MSTEAPLSTEPAVGTARARPSTREALWPVTPLLAGVFVLMMANGLQTSLVVLRATAEQFGTAATGLISSAYFAGFLVGGRLSGGAIQRVGHLRAFAAFASIASSMVLLHALAVNVPVWLVARFATGICISGLVVIIESWLNSSVDNTSRGRVLSGYMVMNIGGYAVGQVLLAAFPVESFELFALVSVLLSVALVPPILARRSNPRVVTVAPMPMTALMRRTPGGAAASAMAGLTWGAIAGWSAVVAAAIGQRGLGVTIFVTSFLVGHLVIEPLVGALSDRTDRRLVLMTTSLAATAAAVVAAFAAPRPLPLIALGFLIGGLTLPMYSVSIAIAGDRLEPDETVAAAGALVRINGVGAAAGPLLASAATVTSVAGFYWLIAAGTTVAACVGAGLLYRSGYRAPKVPYLHLATRGTATLTVSVLRATGRQRARLRRARQQGAAPTDGPGRRRPEDGDGTGTDGGHRHPPED